MILGMYCLNNATNIGRNHFFLLETAIHNCFTKPLNSQLLSPQTVCPSKFPFKIFLSCTLEAGGTLNTHCILRILGKVFLLCQAEGRFTM